ncbi:Non-specific serine/threonine protein kinase protein, partial [Dioscorea alata]
IATASFISLHVFLDFLSFRKAFRRGNGRGSVTPSPSASPPPSYLVNRIQPMATKAMATNVSIEPVHRPSNRVMSRETFPEDGELSGNHCPPDGPPDISDESTFSKNSFTGGIPRDWEVEMKRLKLELKQTMDMYSTACKEAISAKQKAKELHEWKVVETRKFEEVRQAEEAALAMAEMEKTKCIAAMQAAEAAKKLAEMEAKRRHNAENKAKKEGEEKQRALNALAHNDVRYRKYDIDEIELATGHFSPTQLIGEGGYGPVYRASLNHTAVAIKVLRPDAQQGRKQFQQEVEVLSCIRHPNMVLLLGACPEYGCLVYEFMDYGSLEDRLCRRGDTLSIPWPIRFKIAAEVATALLFLHQTKPEPLVHRDLKPANILLDRNYVSKISDVGLARLVPPSVADSVTQYRMTSTAGTFCYIDPEYQQTGMLGTKSDIYSLGVMLLQIITAKPPMGLTHIVERALNKGRFRRCLIPLSQTGRWRTSKALHTLR